MATRGNQPDFPRPGPRQPIPPDRTFRDCWVILPWICVPDNMRITNLTFRGCEIYGPGILVVESDCRFQSCWSQGSFEGAAWVLPSNPSGSGLLIQGAIPARNLTFEGCWFYGVGFAAPAEEMADLARNIGWMFEDSPHLHPPLPGQSPTSP
jgi:hypothetical protein